MELETVFDAFATEAEAQLTRMAEEIRSLRSQLETRAAVQPVAGKDGRDGIDGKDGRDGKDGAPGAKGDAGPAGKDGERGPQGERGADGLQGRDGAPGAPGERGLPGERGAQGERGADGMQGRDGANGKDGERGERGADGIATRDELDALIEARFAELQVRTFADVYQGVFEPDKAYTRGLLTTWGGSLWLSLADTRSKPGENGDWRLIVKKGSDGRK